jgi:hypothetical protein
MKWLLLNILITLTLTGYGQTVVWFEGFESYSDGDVVAADNNSNDAGADWTLVNTALNAGTFQVQNSNSLTGSNSFSANRANGYSVNGSIWTSEVIDVSAYSVIDIGVTIEEVGNLEVEDFIDVEYSLNSGAWTDMTNGQHNSDFGGPLLATDNLTGVLTTVQIRVKSYSNANGEQIIFDDVYVNGITPLPVELIYFNSTIDDTNTTFEWATASEINNDYFELQESSDGIHFNTINLIEGAGNSFTLIEYSITLPTRPTQTYYRLKQNDYNGTYALSSIISTFVAKRTPIIVGVYDIRGKEVSLMTSGIIIIRYDDGTYEKKLNL